ncbi:MULTISPECIES: hypothetical protein [Pseudoalteromonas]|uniref:Uncharacterized protein n=1 Tax=Pseudoalteromonas rubra TaxID=43658 RepID=A0A5S3X204_9GAMM|nr:MULTISPECIES: hypothetical protein [Pseudoalteromonas]MCG7537079.1 hypothetical protein [Pseudoalteromonas sp. OOF1S-7]TMP38374.1 hypothetical protein CWB98_06480 [Pseudoalteromonas rubra]
MASTNLACSVEQGFNFQKDAQIQVGHITSLKIGDKEYKKDLAVTVPTDISGDKVKVVGVISNIFWEGGHADPIMFGCRISTDNKESSVLLQHTSMSDTSVSFSFVIYDYDPKEKKFYPNFHTNETDLNGLVAKNGGELDFGVDLDQADDVVSPKNFSFFLGVMPTEEEQEAHFAVNTSAKFVKKWGVSVAE